MKGMRRTGPSPENPPSWPSWKLTADEFAHGNRAKVAAFMARLRARAERQLLRMTHQTFAEDPEPELPRAFTDPKRVAKLAEKEAPPAISAVSAAPPGEKAWRPQRLVRTCLSSMAEASVFGQQMKREATVVVFRSACTCLCGRRSSLALVCVEALLSKLCAHP